MKFIKLGVILFAVCLSGIILMKIANAGWLSGVFLQNGMPATSEMPAWQADIIWSWDDQSNTEAEVLNEVQNLDVKYNKDMYAWCFWPGDVFGRGGRA
jgi:hypothetical protein